MGSEPQLPVRMGAEHSLTLRMDDEPPLPGKLQEDLRRCTTMKENARNSRKCDKVCKKCEKKARESVQ